jgi:GNAT superfamily N-acetyltransferase
VPTIEELAEDTVAYLPRSTMFEPAAAEGCVHVFGRDVLIVTRIRRIDLEAARAAARQRGVSSVEWWLGPSSPPGAEAELVEAGLVPDVDPTLTGMTCATAPPEVPDVEVRPADMAEVARVEHAVWGGEAKPPRKPHPTIHHFAALVDGILAGVGRAIDMDQGVALMGGAVLPELRGRGAYRALVRARWEHAVARGTPLLVVQAGPMSAPVLDRLGFERHATLSLWVDRL